MPIEDERSIRRFFQDLGLDKKEIDVLMSVLRLGVQPASVIAKHARVDRTTTYRILKKLTEKKMLVEAKQHGVTVFYLKKVSDIQRYIQHQKRQLDYLEEEFEYFSPQLSSIRSSVQILPRIQIYEGADRLEHFYHDIVERAVEQKLLLIRILGSNTFSQKLEQKELGGVMKDFAKALKAHAIESDVLIAQGNLTREWLTHLGSFSTMANLPAAGGATNVILVGDSVFMVSFRDFPVGVRIDHPDMAQTMHFLFDVGRGSSKVSP